MDRKKVVVIGANGSISQVLVTKLIKNFEVWCVTRSPPSFGINSIFLKFVEGDALSPALWDECLEGKDAVICTFGVRNG